MRITIQRLIFILFALLLAAPLNAAFIIVNTADNEVNNDGDCSLREAVRSANENMSFDNCTAGAGIGTDDIFIGQTGTITVSLGLVISERVNIFGPGIDSLTLDGGFATPIFIVDLPDDNHDFELSLMTLQRGSSASPGGAVRLLRGGTFSFENIRFVNNSVAGLFAYGGAIATDSLPAADTSRLEIRRCIFESNTSESQGGAVAIDRDANFQRLDALIIEESEFSNNSADSSGGAVSSGRSSFVSIDRSRFENNEGITGGAVELSADTSGSALRIVSASTFKNNQATNTGTSGGGAIVAVQGVTLIENSTFTDNFSASQSGNAIETRTNEVMAIYHSTFLDNEIGRTTENVLAASGGSDLSLDHSIVYSQNASSKPECLTADPSSTFTSLGYNIDASGTCTGHPDDLPMTDPQLAPLGDYGDASNFVALETFLPKATGPAIEGGKLSPCTGGFGATLGNDQRGENRPSITRCDIGAVEFQAGVDPSAFQLEVTIASANGTVTSSPEGIQCPDDCTEGYLDNAQITLTATPDPGFVFSGWGGDCSGITACQVVMDTNRSITASFKAQTYPVSVSIIGDGRVANLSNVIDCPGTCVADFPSTSLIELVATPSPGFEFVAWGGDCSFEMTPSCEFRTNQARNVTATFARVDVPLTLRLEGPGTGRVTSSPAGVDCTADCSATFPPDTAVELNASADPGSAFQNWTGACTGTGPCNVVLDVATTVGAVFVDDDALFVDGFE